jgi:hypothetical protein
MPNIINMVYSQPPADAAEADFNRWYDEHRFEVLPIAGWLSVQRFELLPVVTNPDAPLPYRYLALSEFDREPAEVMAEMARRGMSSRESYIELKKYDSTGPALPYWWDDVRFASWNGRAAGDRVESSVTRRAPGDAEGLYIVFSQPPTGDGEDAAFNVWYDAHLYEILEIPGFVAAQRFSLDAEVRNPDAPAPYLYAALFEVNTGPDEINAAMASRGLNSRDSYVQLKETHSAGPPLPAWWDRVRFASWNAVPVSARVESTASGDGS